MWDKEIELFWHLKMEIFYTLFVSIVSLSDWYAEEYLC
jgi:hypothetical protein